MIIIKVRNAISFHEIIRSRISFFSWNERAEDQGLTFFPTSKALLRHMNTLNRGKGTGVNK